MSLCIRYVTSTNFDVREEFLTLKHMTDVDAKSLCDAIVNTYNEMSWAEMHGRSTVL